MQFSQENLNALTEAIAEGVREVKYQDKEVTYRSLDEMLRLRDIMLRDLGHRNQSNTYYADFDKGH